MLEIYGERGRTKWFNDRGRLLTSGETDSASICGQLIQAVDEHSEFRFTFRIGFVQIPDVKMSDLCVTAAAGVKLNEVKRDLDLNINCSF